jgi:1-acyl-sn-glycerol-3-phosphate acyltransferase
MDTVYRGVNKLGGFALRCLDARVVAEGLEHLPLTGPVVLAANHVSYLDFLMIEKAAVQRGRYVRFLTRHDVWKPGPLAWAMDRMRHVPVDRTAPASAYLTARRLLREGEAVGVFPEAGISWSFTVRGLMRGAVALARETGAPLVPVSIWGSQRIYSVGIPELPIDLTRGRRIDVAFGAPRLVGPDADLVAQTQALGHTLHELVERSQARPEHQPRPGELAAWHPAHLGGGAPSRSEAAAYEDLPSGAVTPTWWPAPGDDQAAPADPRTR